VVLRIVHTADWHLGHTLAGHSRDGEFRAVLAALVRVVVEREAEALIIAGDVFDHQNPSGEAQRLFYETLLALHRARPRLTIVVTAGNHDAAGRLEAPRTLLETLGVHVIGNVVRRPDGSLDAARHLVPLRDAAGRVAAHVLAVSYPTAACLPVLGSDAPDTGSPIVWATRALYAELAAATRAVWQGLPLVVSGHLHVRGATETEGSERRILVGGEHAVPSDALPAEAAYVALGHLHKAQGVGAAHIRYSGSLLPISASEIDYAHGVTLVTLDGAARSIEHIPLPRPLPFLRVPEQGEARFEDLEGLLQALSLPDQPVDRRPFAQLRLAREGLPPGFRAEAERIAEAFPLRVVDVRVAPLAAPAASLAEAEPVERLSELQPEELFRRAFAKAIGAEPLSAHLEAFHAAAAAAAHLERGPGA